MTDRSRPDRDDPIHLILVVGAHRFDSAGYPPGDLLALVRLWLDAIVSEPTAQPTIDRLTATLRTQNDALAAVVRSVHPSP